MNPELTSAGSTLPPTIDFDFARVGVLANSEEVEECNGDEFSGGIMQGLGGSSIAIGDVLDQGDRDS